MALAIVAGGKKKEQRGGEERSERLGRRQRRGGRGGGGGDETQGPRTARHWEISLPTGGRWESFSLLPMRRFGGIMQSCQIIIPGSFLEVLIISPQHPEVLAIRHPRSP